MSPGDKKITVVGAGYVGLTLASVLANVGYKVYILDHNASKIGLIKGGKSPFYEAGLESFMKNGLESGKLVPVCSYKECVLDSDVVFVCVGTPSNSDGSICLDNVLSAMESIVDNARRDMIIVQKSTVPVGFGKQLKENISQKNEKNLKLSLIVNPEFLREGSAIFDTLFPERIVIGGGDLEADELILIHREIDSYAAKSSMDGLNEYAFVYRDFSGGAAQKPFEERVMKTSMESAEMIKMTSNAFLAMKISYANMIARMCQKTGANTKEVMRGLGSDSRIGSDFLYPGLGYGGGCFAKDVSGMIKSADSLEVDSGILDAVKKINDTQVYIALDKMRALLDGDFHGKRVAFLGLSFKPGSSDVRESMALRLLDKVLLEGMFVKAYDPKANEDARGVMVDEKLEIVNRIEDVFGGADIVVLATGWKEFIEFDYSKAAKKMRKPNFFDGRGVMDAKKLVKMGFNVDFF